MTWRASGATGSARRSPSTDARDWPDRGGVTATDQAGAPPGPAIPPPGVSLLRIVHVLWSGTCLAALVLLIAGRWLRYTSWSTSPRIDALLREFMVVDVQAFLWPWAYTTLELPAMLLAVGIVGVALHRRAIERVDGVWQLKPLATSILTGAILLFHYAFDVNPTVTLACVASLVLAWVTEEPRVARTVPGSVLRGAWVVFVLYCVIAARDWTDRLAIGAWFVVLLGTSRYLRPRVRRLELTLVRVIGFIPMNLLPATLPLLLPLHGGP